MSLQAILDAIAASGTAATEQIAAEAEATADRLLTEAQETAATRRSAAYRQALAPLAGARAQRRQKARLAAGQRVLEARECLVTEALAATERRLTRFRERSAYAGVLARLVAEAVAALQGEDGPPRIAADPRDADLLAPILVDLDLPATAVAYTLTCWGGVVVSSEDGRIVIDNTLASRLARAEPELRQRLARQLLKNGSDNGRL